MTYTALPLPPWQNARRPLGAFFFAFFLAAALAVMVLTGCQGCSGSLPVPTTPRERARAAVLVLAEGVRVADQRCAEVAADAGNLSLADRCAKAYATGRSSLLVAAGAVDAWDEGRQGETACAAAVGLDAATELASLISSAGADVPAVLEDGLKLAKSFAPTCSTAPEGGAS